MQDIGSGGGHYYKAGGFIPMDLLIDSYNVYCKEKDVTPRFQYSSDGTHKRLGFCNQIIIGREDF